MKKAGAPANEKAVTATDNPNSNPNTQKNTNASGEWKNAPPSSPAQNAQTQGTAPPLVNEFRKSQTYQVLNQVGGVGDKVAHGINRAVTEIDKAVGEVTRSVTQATQGRPPQNNTTYHYSYTNGKPNPAPTPQNHYYTPQSRVQPVPPPQKPKMVKKHKPSNTKFWFAGIICMLYAVAMPMHSWPNLAVFAGVAAAAFFVGRALFRGKKYYVPEEPPKPVEPVKPAEPKKSATGNPEVDKIIDEGQEYLKQLRAANDRIPDAVMSDRISRMEVASADIFAYIAEHPEKAAQIRRFMSYYLPTTLKLLKSYEQLSRQRVKGENIQKTMFEIEGMMETIATAFEKQLDGLFSEDAMDISADISVMESILKQEGLSDDDSGEMPKVKTETATVGNAAVKTEAGGIGSMPSLTLDPEDETKS